MKLEKLSRLFSALTTPAPTSQSKPAEESTAASQEAVTIAAGFGGQGNSENAAKVARIKEEVRNGTYKVRSEEVAKSIIKELFA